MCWSWEKRQDGSIKIFRKAEPSFKASCLMQRDINEVNSCIRKDIEKKANGNSKRCRYAENTSDQRANIGKRGVENGSTRASRHFSVPESTARRLKKEYLQKMVKVYIYMWAAKTSIPSVSRLPIKSKGRPLLLGKNLDDIIQRHQETVVEWSTQQ